MRLGILIATLCTSAAILVALEVGSPTVADGPGSGNQLRTAQADLRILHKLVLLHRQTHKALPKSLIELGGTRVLLDPWGQPYAFERVAAGDGFMVYSIGRDGTAQAGAGDDVVIGDKNYDCKAYNLTCSPSPSYIAKALCVVSILAVAVALLGEVTWRLWRRRVKNAT